MTLSAASFRKVVLWTGDRCEWFPTRGGYLFQSSDVMLSTTGTVGTTRTSHADYTAIARKGMVSGAHVASS